MKNLFSRALLVLSLGACAFTADAAPVPAPASAPSRPALQTAPGPYAAPPEDILDIRGPIHIPTPFPWLPWTAGAVGVAALGLGAWAWFRRPRRKLPYELALEKLEATRPLMQNENAQPFSLAVSEIVRRFIEECLPVRAAHRTTSEFLHDLVSLPESPLAGQREMLADFLEHCDLAKFARWSLTVPQMEAMLASARAFVLAIGQPNLTRKPNVTLTPEVVRQTALTHS
ncbi:MAG: DUF4381 family protein [Chthoniobacterales bacterium]